MKRDFSFWISRGGYTPPAFRLMHARRAADWTVSRRDFRFRQQQRRRVWNPEPYCSDSLYRMLHRAARDSIFNMRILKAHGAAICYNCSRRVDIGAITFRAESRGDKTAWCPACGIDAVVPATPLTRRYIALMYAIMFEGLAPRWAGLSKAVEGDAAKSLSSGTSTIPFPESEFTVSISGLASTRCRRRPYG